MEPEIKVTFLQESTTDPYPETDESNLHSHILLSYDTF
jgi:hypothetical protein